MAVSHFQPINSLSTTWYIMWWLSRFFFTQHIVFRIQFMNNSSSFSHSNCMAHFGWNEYIFRILTFHTCTCPTQFSRRLLVYCVIEYIRLIQCHVALWKFTKMDESDTSLQDQLMEMVNKSKLFIISYQSHKNRNKVTKKISEKQCSSYNDSKYWPNS